MMNCLAKNQMSIWMKIPIVIFVIINVTTSDIPDKSDIEREPKFFYNGTKPILEPKLIYCQLEPQKF